MALKKPERDAASGARTGARKPVDFARECPTLADYLFDTAYEKGEPRKTSTITIMARDTGGFKAVLNDRQERQSLWVTGETMDELMQSFEVLLTDEAPPWVPDSKYTTGGKK